MSTVDAFPNPLVTATSAVNLDKDKAIQEIIWGPDFADVTLLMIAYIPRFKCVVLETCTQLFLQPPFEYHHRL